MCITFSLYSRHLNLLCHIAESSHVKNRRLALEILQNMASNTDNRAALLTSSDFQRVMFSVLSKTEFCDEQVLITVSIWKLIKNSSKGINAIKNSPIFGKLRNLKDALDRRSQKSAKSHRSNRNLIGEQETNDESDNETIVELKEALKCVLTILLA